MARGGGEDIDSLLREVDQTLGRSGAAPARRKGATAATPVREGYSGRSVTSVATISAVSAAVVVFVLFALLPILGAVSGAAGAFLGVFVAVLVTGVGGRRRRR